MQIGRQCQHQRIGPVTRLQRALPLPGCGGFAAQEDDAPPIAHHHVHFVNREFVEMGQWYMRALNATERPGATDFFFGADLPGVGYMLNYFSWLPAEDLVGTADASKRTLLQDSQELRFFVRVSRALF